jgi:cytidylate kinase
MAVITISRQYGSGGDEIADRVGEILGYPHFDKSMITQAAAEAGISETEVFDYSEDSHKVRSFMDRLFNRSVMMTTGHMLESGGFSVYDMEVPLGQDVMLGLVQKAIRSAYEMGNMVIMGRGSQVILQDKAKAVHIRIEAPVEYRIQRLKEQLKQTRQVLQSDIEVRRDAQDIILERDAASADYIKRHYNRDWNDAQLYHVVLNTGKISIDRATQIMVDLVKDL